MEQIIDRAALKRAFHTLRKEGFVALQNHLCCASCGSYSIAQRVEERKEAGAHDPKGCVWFHNQDHERMMNGGSLMIRFGSVDTAKFGPVGLPTETVGKRAVEVFESAGLFVKWDGDPDHCIEIYVPSVLDRMEKQLDQQYYSNPLWC